VKLWNADRHCLAASALLVSGGSETSTRPSRYLCRYAALQEGLASGSQEPQHASSSNTAAAFGGTKAPESSEGVGDAVLPLAEDQGAAAHPYRSLGSHVLCACSLSAYMCTVRVPCYQP